MTDMVHEESMQILGFKLIPSPKGCPNLVEKAIFSDSRKRFLKKLVQQKKVAARFNVVAIKCAESFRLWSVRLMRP